MSKSTTITDAQLGAAVRTVFAALFSGVAVGAVTAAAEAPKEEPKSDPKPQTDAGSKEQGSSGSSTPDQAKGDEAPSGPTQAEVLKAVLAYAGKTSKAAAEELLAGFNATKVSELDAKDYPAVLEKLSAADLS